MATALFLSPNPIPKPYLSLPHIPFANYSFLHNRYCHRQSHVPNNLLRKIPLYTFSFRNGSTPSEAKCPVPLDQQPIIEYQSLSTSFPFSWASGDVVEYASRLFVTGLSFSVLVGLPVSWFGTIGSEPEPVNLVLGSAFGGLFVVTLAVVRMYLGWAYVGNRLLSATVEYEETGWYDGQIWVKTAEVLARDRLLGSFQVKPVLGRLKNTLIGLAASLLACVLILVNVEESQKNYKPFDTEERVVAGAYNDESARLFEPDAFCGESSTITE